MSQHPPTPIGEPPFDPTATDWRWEVDFFHVHGLDGLSTALVSLKDRDGQTVRAKGEGQTPLHALLDAIGRITECRYALRSARIYAVSSEGQTKSQAHIVLVDKDSKGRAGFGWATSEHDAFMIAALRIVNAREAEQQAEDAYVAKGVIEAGWRKSRNASKQQLAA